MANQRWMMQIIEALNTLWVTLPLRNITDERATLEAYGFALEGNSVEAVQNVVNALRRGEIEDASKQWCPKPPELATFVRVEQKRLDALNRRPAVSYQPVSQAWKDWRVIHRAQTEELQAHGFTLVKQDVAIDAWVSVSKRRGWPIGATWLWSLGEVWAPIGAAYPSTGIIGQEMAA